MSLDPIQLPDFVIADLFKNSLVEIEKPENTIKQPPKKSQPEVITKKTDETVLLQTVEKIKYLGQNKKQVLVIVNNTDETFVNDSDLKFLTNILKACNLTLGDIAIINHNMLATSFTEIKEQLAAKYLLLFGVEPGDIKLPFIIPMFQVQQYADCTLVTAPSLSELDNPSPDGKVLKGKLWTSLQRCFDI